MVAERPADPSDPSAGATSGDVDWFGFPVERPREPVPCPRCDAVFTDRRAYAAHLEASHGVRAPGGRAAAKREQPALGRNHRSSLSRRLRTLPLVIVLAANVAVALATAGALSAIGPAWWDDLVAQPWGLVVLIPLLWPTILFLALRGFD